ncbi:MAG: hypothetical protein ABI789_01965 [Usitatibacter sp.]
MAKQTINAEQLHALLVAEFNKSRAIECVTRCRVTEPIFREPKTEGAPNWHVKPSLTCPRHCHRIIEDVVARLGEAYDLEPPARVVA